MLLSSFFFRSWGKIWQNFRGRVFIILNSFWLGFQFLKVSWLIAFNAFVYANFRRLEISAAETFNDSYFQQTYRNRHWNFCLIAFQENMQNCQSAWLLSMEFLNGLEMFFYRNRRQNERKSIESFFPGSCLHCITSFSNTIVVCLNYVSHIRMQWNARRLSSACEERLKISISR